MPSEPAKLVHVEYTPEFKRNLRALAKKYRDIRSHVQPVIDQLRAAEVMGDQVPRTRYTKKESQVSWVCHGRKEAWGTTSGELPRFTWRNLPR